MRWFGFFSAGENAKKIAVLIGILFLPSVGWAQASRQADNSMVDEKTKEYLAAPLFKLDWETSAPQGEIQIGDRLHLRAFPAPDSSGEDLAHFQNSNELQFVSPPGGSPLLQLGWFILPDTRKIPEKNEVSFVAVPMENQAREIPPLAIQTKEGTIVARTASFSVDLRPLESAKDLPPFLPPLHIQYPWVFWVLVGVLVLFILVLSIVWFIRWRRARQPEKEEEEKTPDPEDELALKALEVLETQELWQSGNFKKLYFGVSEILKAYLGSRYGFDARESTTEELLVGLSRTIASPEVREKVEKFYRRLDLVKFTDFVPGSTEASGLIEDARKFVVSTRRPRIAVDPGEGKEVHAIQ